MAERIVQEESLTTVADAIRAKGGTTDPLSFPDGFKTAIEAIQAGGGGIAAGEFTISDYPGVTTYTVEHGLGERPSMIIIGKKGTSGASKYVLSLSAFWSTESANLGLLSLTYGNPDSVNTIEAQSAVVGSGGLSNYGWIITRNRTHFTIEIEETLLAKLGEKELYIGNGPAYVWLAM